MGDQGGPGRHAIPTRVFLSYRRDLSFDVAGRLHDALERRHLGSTFQDIEDLRAGQEWATQLDDALNHEDLRCFVLVVGAGFWSYPGKPPAAGDPLLWREDDAVLHEIQIARRRAEANPDTFRFLVVLQDRSCTLPTFAEQTAPGIPDEVVSALEYICALHVDHRVRLDSTSGVEAVREQIEAAVIEAGATGFRDVRTLVDLYALDAPSRGALAISCERALAANAHDHRSAVLFALVRILDARGYETAAKVLDPLSGGARSRFESATGKAIGEGRIDDAYWATMARVVTVIAELRGDRPRRLGNLTEARDMVLDRLLPAIHVFASIEAPGALPAGVRMAKEGPAATVTSDDVRAGLQLAVALTQAVVTDYFRSRGVLVSRSNQLEVALMAELAHLAERIDAEVLMRWLQQEGYLATWPMPQREPQPTPPYPTEEPDTERPRRR